MSVAKSTPFSSNYIKDLEDNIIEAYQEIISDNNDYEKELFVDGIHDFMYEYLDSEFIYYKDQLECVKELHLYSWEHLDNPTNLAQVCFYGVMDELVHSGEIFDEDNYIFNK